MYSIADSPLTLLPYTHKTGESLFCHCVQLRRTTSKSQSTIQTTTNMAGNLQICVAGWLSNMGDMEINYLTLLSACLLCRLMANHSVQIDTTSEWAVSAHTTSKWAKSAHITSKWAKLTLLPRNELNQLILPPNEPNQLKWPPNEPNQLISPLCKLNKLNDLYVSYWAQLPMCELPSSTTYMWATDLNNPNRVQRALRTKTPRLRYKSG